MHEIGITTNSAFEETSGVLLTQGGLKQLNVHLTSLKSGGVLFIDEAYQLNPATDSSGLAVIDFLLPEMENRRGSLVVVLAGYKEPIMKLLKYNPGLPRRFPCEINFSDYNDIELTQIMTSILAKRRFVACDPKYVRIAVRRLGRLRDIGVPGFGNAGAVRNLVDTIIDRQSSRLTPLMGSLQGDALLRLERVDFLGPRTLDRSASPALLKLKAMVGLEKVKQSVEDLLGLIESNAELEEAELPLRDICLNRVFLGNPGSVCKR